MRTLFAAFAIAFCLAGLAAAQETSPKPPAPIPAKDAGPAEELVVKAPIKLFNGENMDGWKAIMQDPKVDPYTVWSVKDGVLLCSGTANGYLRTEKEYAVYSLSLEWRFPTKAGNSGVFLNISGENKVWPLCFQSQVKTGEVGDFHLMGGAECNEVNQPRLGKLRKEHIPRFHPIAEKPIGEWNRFRAEVYGDRILVFHEGQAVQLINVVSGVKPDKGFIGLQSEGSAIEFRNITIGPSGLKQAP